MKRRILVVDDDESMLVLLKFILENNGYLAVEAQNYGQAVEVLKNERIDCAILDVQLPDKSGLMILQFIRNNYMNPTIPVVMVTSQKDEIDSVLGLEMGADDYIHKPVKKRELIARIEGIFRRIEMDQTSLGHQIPIGKLFLQTLTRRLVSENENIDLAPKEYALLFLLASNPGKVFSRAELLDRVWGVDVAIESRTVDVHIRKIRQKIETHDNFGAQIETVRGYGYRYLK